MGALTRFATWLLSKAEQSPGAEASASSFMWSGDRAFGSAWNQEQLVSHFRRWVFVCVSRNAQTIAQIPLRLYRPVSRRKSKAALLVPAHVRDELLGRRELAKALSGADALEEVVDHPVLSLFAHVNDFDNRFDLLELREVFIGLTGNAYWYLVRDNGGMPRELWTVPSQHMRVVPDKKDYVAGYEFGYGPSKREFTREEIIRFKSPNPLDQLYGYPELHAVIDETVLLDDMIVYEGGLLRNSATPSMFLRVAPGATSQEVTRVVKQTAQRFGGPRNAGRIMAASGVDGIERIAHSPKDMDHPEGRKWIKEVTCGAFGVPLSLLGVEGVNLANARSGLEQYMRFTIKPKLAKLDDTLNQDLLPAFGEDGMVFAHDNPVPQDRELRLKERKTLLSTGVPVNVLNAQDGLDPVEGGDIPLVLRALVPLSDVGAAPTPQGAPPAKSKRKRLDVPVLKAALSRDNPPFRRELAAIFTEMEAEVLANMRAFEGRGATAPAEKRVTGYTYADLEYWRYDGKRWIKAMHDRGRPFLEDAMVRGADAALADLPADIGGTFEITNPAVQGVLRAQAAQFSSAVVESNGAMLVTALRKGIDDGEGMDKLTQRVRDVFDVARKSDAERIARTETMQALNGGAVEMFKASEVVTDIEWSAAGDACEFCISMHGEIIELGGDFREIGQSVTGSQGGSYRVSYRNVGYPPLHPNCRCSALPVLRSRV